MTELTRYQKYKASYQAYEQTHRAEIARNNRLFYERHPNYQIGRYNTVVAECFKNWKMNNPEKNRIHQLLSHHPERYPIDSECIFCGSTKRLERSHLDYDGDGFNYVTACHACNIWMNIPLETIVLPITTENKPT